MLKANLDHQIITNDVDNFSLEGMIEPTFYNFGDDDVEVMNSVIKPENKFFAGVIGMVMNNTVPIVFKKDDPNAKKRLIVYYGTQTCD